MTHLRDIKYRNYVQFRCRRVLFIIVDQAAFSFRNSVDIAELDTLISRAKSFGQELSNNLKAKNEQASS